MTATAASPPLPWDVVTGGETETVDRGRRLASLLVGGETIRLEGGLGAGKTVFTRGLALGLGADEAQVHSPSYSLVHLYRDSNRRPVLYHVDLYRVEGEQDLEELGLEEVVASAVPVAVEWAERLEGTRHLPAPGDLHVRLEVLSPDERRLRVARDNR